MTQARTTRLSVAALVAVLHLVAVAALIRAFAPDLARDLVPPAVAAFSVPVPPPPAPPPASPPAVRHAPTEARGAAAPAGRFAKPREVAAPRSAVVVPRDPAPPISGLGTENSAGARSAGVGTGAGGAGQGTGAGAGGSGIGGGVQAVKIAGDIVSARDYPEASRALRLGSAVTIALTVSPEGRVTDCRVVRASRDPAADSVTCRLAMERFRFRPARDAGGRAIPSVYGWQQRWFVPERE